MALQSRTYKDLNLNFTVHPIKKDLTPITDEAAIKRSVQSLIFTKNYEVPFHPEIGCSATALLFENISPFTAAQLQRSIREVLDNFEPRVTVTDVLVSVKPEQNGYEAVIVFYINNRPEPITFDLFLEKLR
jgi:phage baseplate assembly protein W